MLLKQKGVSFRFDITGYEFPSSVEYYDANWLIVKISASDERNLWEAEDRCLLTYELQEMVEWLKTIENRKNISEEIRFMENELKFAVSKDLDVLYVVLDFNFHPKGVNYIYGTDGDEEYNLEFEINEKIIQKLILDFQNLSINYPERIKRKKNQ